MVRSKAQLLIEQLDRQLTPQDEWTPVVPIAVGSTMIAQEVTKHRTRSKYGLGDHVVKHFQDMHKIRQKEIPQIDKRQEYKELRHNTLRDMAQKVHDLRKKRGLSTGAHKEERIANRAFYGTLSGAPRAMFRNTPHV